MHSTVYQNRFESYTNNYYAVYTGFFNAPSSQWKREQGLTFSEIPSPEAAVSSIKGSATSADGYCEAISNFDISDNFISITTDDNIYNSTGLPIQVETDLSSSGDDSGDDTIDGGGDTSKVGQGALGIQEKTAPNYPFELSLSYVWRSSGSSKFDYYDKNYLDTISLSAQMLVYEPAYTFKSETMPAQATKNSDNY
mmetsp:Transcript_2704/g.4247  ORF Transcript_2704/g.4247 Transcript_2704/m.4247 type:complete len:196 (+) Transcript_2704:1865-2452(+)